MKDALVVYSLVCFVSVAGLPHLQPQRSAIVEIPSDKTVQLKKAELVSTPLDNLPNVVGGENAEKGEFPWQCTIKVEIVLGLMIQICGAVIYDSSTILTAAHCLEGQNVTTLMVVCGDHNVLINEGSEQYIRVSSFVIHPNRNKETKDSDFAYLTLAQPLELNDLAKPIALAGPDFQATGKCITTGWGKLNGNGKGNSAAILQKVSLELVPHANCKQRYSEEIEITDSMVCGGYINPEQAGDEKGPCNGDSGGPFVCPGQTGQYELVGVVSFASDPCALVEFPTVFASIPHLGSWIRQSLADSQQKKLM